MYKAELAFKAEAKTGEGSLWDSEAQRLYWVDIPSGELYLYDPKDGSNRTIYQVNEPIGTVVQRERGGVLAAQKNGIYAVDEATGKATVLCSLAGDDPGNRCNDGKCDPAGRFWVGTMGGRGKGGLYRVDHDGKVTKVLSHMSIPNGIIWSGDAKTMYHTDTETGVICAYDYDIATGDISNRRVVVKIKEGEGGPDGFTIDSEGMLWVAQWGGWQVGRYNPATGEKLDMVEVPAAQVSSCAFGGENMDTLFITTARGGQEAKLEKQPLAGSLFQVKVGVKGVKANKFKG